MPYYKLLARTNSNRWAIFAESFPDRMRTCFFKIVQIYSDRSGFQLVSQASLRLRREFERSDWAETSWNTELLRSPKLRMLAAREAAEADIVLVAAEEGAGISPEVGQWLELWRRRSRPTRSTLVALLRRNAPTDSPLVEDALHTFAISAGMDFFCHSQVSSRSKRRMIGQMVLL